MQKPEEGPRPRRRPGMKHGNRLLATSEGRMNLAASMIAPLRPRLDYEGLARRVFLVEPLPEGALPVYGRMASLEEG